MKCPRCTSESAVKNGKIQNRQRFKCKDCGCNYTVEMKSSAKPKETKRMALELYLEGLGFHSISRILKVSHVAVIKWIKDFGKQIEFFKRDSPATIIEMDELHTYMGQKKTIAGYGLLLIELRESSSVSYLVRGEQRQVPSYGK